VISRAANRQRSHTILSRNATHVGPETSFQFMVDEWESFLCAEDVMDEIAHVRVWHDDPLSRPFHGLIEFLLQIPSAEALGYSRAVRFADSNTSKSWQATTIRAN
jgi:hypothetical protein